MTYKTGEKMTKKTKKQLAVEEAPSFRCVSNRDVLEYVQYKRDLAYAYWKKTGLDDMVVFAYQDVLDKFRSAVDNRNALKLEKINAAAGVVSSIEPLSEAND